MKAIKKHLFPIVIVIYFALNLVFFYSNPYSSSWHYGSKDPTPIEVVQPTDSNLSVNQIVKILDSIDLSYGAREPTASEKAWRLGSKITQVAFLPSSIALVMKSFIDYMGPANSEQRAFTISVKQRYNHLARMALQKGMKKDGFFYQEEASLSKKNGEPF